MARAARRDKEGPRTPHKPRSTHGHQRVKNIGDRQLNSVFAAKFRGAWRQFRKFTLHEQFRRACWLHYLTATNSWNLSHCARLFP
jgi:hypothetical protein